MRTIPDYSWTWQKYVDSTTSSLRGLTLQQANDPQRLRSFLQRVAEAHGSASAKNAKSVLHGVIGYAVDNGVLSSDATRQVRTVTTTAARSNERGLLKALTKTVLETALEEEMAEHLGYDRHDPVGRNRGNSRNGKRAKTVLTDSGAVAVEVPRDRDGSFEPVIVAKRQRRLSSIDEIVLSLYARGLTTGDIAAAFRGDL